MYVRPVIAATAAMTAALMCCVVPAQAGMWSNPSGVAQDFTYSNGQDEYGFFGDPIILGNKLIFTPSPFVAHVAAEGTVTRQDKVTFDIAMRPGVRLDGIGSIGMSGYYAAEGADSMVDASSRYGIHEQGGLGRHLHANMVTQAVQFPVTADVSAVSGMWDGEVEVPVPGPANALYRFLHIEFSTVVMAEAYAGGTATVSQVLPQVEFSFEFSPLPEPGSALLVVLSGVVLFRRTYNRRAFR